MVQEGARVLLYELGLPRRGRLDVVGVGVGGKESKNQSPEEKTAQGKNPS